jgi:hypothetical protein
MTTSFGVPCLSNVVRELWERADEHLNQEELEWFVGTLGHAEFVAGNLSKTVEDIGCLINDGRNDDGQKDDPKSVSFFRAVDDVPTLLWVIADAINNLQALISVGDNAVYQLLEMKRAQSETESPAGEAGR